MLKALIKKQFAELGAAYAFSKKTGKKRSKGGITGIAALLLFSAISIGFAFFGMGMLFASNFVPMGLDWLYFAMMGMIAVFVSIIGEVFGTYSMLYNAKDNDALLSMPIPPRIILLSRMTTLYIMSAGFVALVFIPALIAYFLNAPFSAVCLVFGIIMIFVLGLLALMLACLLGGLVALIGSKIRGNKAVITVIVSLILLGAYYVIYFRMNKLLQSAVENADNIAKAMKSWLIPFYHMGLGTAGSPLHMLLFTAGVIILFTLVWLLLASNFTRLVTRQASSKAKRFESGQIKTASVKKALLGREFKHLSASAAYMLNCGLGVVMALGASVFALIKGGDIRALTSGLEGGMSVVLVLLPAIIAAAIMFLISLNCFTAPSVSLEGQNIWIVQTMPVEAKEVLRSKQYMHVLINGSLAIICTVLLSVAVGISAVDAVFVGACTVGYALLTSAVGLAVNIKKPVLDWTNETVPIKQSASVAIAIFGGMGAATVFAGLAVLLGIALNCGANIMRLYMAAFAAAEIVAAVLVTRWIDNKGSLIFGKL